ncbi:Methyltransferase domain family protein [Candida parapsilosis]|uniref:Methyltransf_11 domain-containing protein n=2 Tax=Candida parapsilosis TaxID=5480 RepID=G8BAS7_CANPC|nr:uncharacterized protein CPAR2_807000 [Candida parapsilosis]KAF6052047.1 Methyltransferase domain family protein [Candida parapsilosis]KAF6052456.1 Methyltransferase domain family protein [Candida parapsilosis]KAF6053849.1 Methyltransferase domain family protein [Candida parapsilosis]KAF6064232.1 Methyltransferase domain family protein [Candida parapsilosis]KAI5902290.1 putative methyltransferase C1347.09 [Candida parapsilosis]
MTGAETESTQAHQHAVELNRQAFDEVLAKKYDKKETQILMAYLFVKHILEFDLNVPVKRKTLEESEPLLGDAHLPFSGFNKEDTLPDPATYLEKYPHSIFRPGMKLMDFACGTGMVTELFVPYLTGNDDGVKSEIVGVDIGTTFLKYFNQRASKLSNDKVSMKSYEYDVLDSNIQPELTKFNNYFDFIFSTISYHHIHNYQQVTKKLVDFLKPGGWMFIIDFYNEDVEDIDETDERSLSNEVQHMGGLKIDKLNHTLGEYSGLVNVSSAREFRANLWQPDVFIRSHSTKAMVDKMNDGELESKEIEGQMNYLVETSFIFAIGQKPGAT